MPETTRDHGPGCVEDFSVDASSSLDNECVRCWDAAGHGGGNMSPWGCDCISVCCCAVAGPCCLQPATAMYSAHIAVVSEFNNLFSNRACTTHSKCCNTCAQSICLGGLCYIYVVYVWFVPVCVPAGCIAYVLASSGLRSLCWGVIGVVRGTCVVARLLCACAYIVFIYPPFDRMPVCYVVAPHC